MTVVSNASPLIAFERIRRQELLKRLFGTIFIPPAVRVEVFGLHQLPDWIVEREPTPAFHPSKSLGRGEVEAIALALELKADWLLMDDLDGRKEAVRLGLTVMGTIGVLIFAKQKGIINAIQPLLDALEAVGFYYGEELRAIALSLAGECP
jgi:predicted nucleic acid-binding protein